MKGRRICRVESNSVEVEGKLFFNKSYSPKNSMRQAAKRFVQSPEFTQDCLCYEGDVVDGRWQFAPVGVGQRF